MLSFDVKAVLFGHIPLPKVRSPGIDAEKRLMDNTVYHNLGVIMQHMSKLALSITLIIGVQISLSALTASEQIPQLIKEDLEGNSVRITALAETLSEAEKDRVYAKAKNRPIIGFALNFLVGYGVGSFVQGDKASGTAAAVLDGLGLASMTVGMVIVDLKVIDLYTGRASTFDQDSLVPGLICVGAGSLLGMAGALVEIIAPWVYAKRYNALLRNAIYGGGELSARSGPAPSLMPFFSLASLDGNLSPVIGLSVSL